MRIELRKGDAVQAALARLQTANVGFADAYLAACAAEDNVPVASFDRDFDKFKDAVRFEPVI